MLHDALSHAIPLIDLVESSLRPFMERFPVHGTHHHVDVPSNYMYGVHSLSLFHTQKTGTAAASFTSNSPAKFPLGRNSDRERERERLDTLRAAAATFASMGWRGPLSTFAVYIPAFLFIHGGS
jgi:hypothetical protein